MTKKNSMERLRERIEERLSKVDGTFGVAFKNLQSGEEMLLNERETFHAASTMKTPVLLEIYRQSVEGKLSLNDSLEIKNTFQSIVDRSPFSLNPADDSEQELYASLGEKESIRSLAYKMIIRSSNLATNMLIERVTADSVMRTMKEIGAADIKVLRGVEDSKAFEKGLNNTTTAYDLMLVFDAIINNKVVNAGSTKEITDILLDQEFKDIIPAKLPPEIRIAHKTGSITGIQHDSGIVFLPDGQKYILVLLSRFTPADEKKVIDAMADVSAMVYQFMTEKKAR